MGTNVGWFTGLGKCGIDQPLTQKSLVLKRGPNACSGEYGADHQSGSSEVAASQSGRFGRARAAFEARDGGGKIGGTNANIKRAGKIGSWRPRIKRAGRMVLG